MPVCAEKVGLFRGTAGGCEWHAGIRLGYGVVCGYD